MGSHRGHLGDPQRDPARDEHALHRNPGQPSIKLSDLKAFAGIAAEISALLDVDNTFSTPLLQRPIDLGANVVVHSMTKYLNGHSDVVAGMIVSADEDVHESLRTMLQSLGGTMDPHQAWLVLRGLRTLALRMQKAQENASRLAEWLENHPRVAWVSYPGLASHPQHGLMKRQMAGPGAMISFGVEGDIETAKAVINSVKLATLAVSLGGIETLIEHPASMTHAGVSAEERLAAGIEDGLVRLSVGCEDVEDLMVDLAKALDAIPAPRAVGG